jgi:hypothetical protein
MRAKKGKTIGARGLWVTGEPSRGDPEALRELMKDLEHQSMDEAFGAQGER